MTPSRPSAWLTGQPSPTQLATIQELLASAVFCLYASVERASLLNDIYASERMRLQRTSDSCIAPISFSIERFAFFLAVVQTADSVRGQRSNRYRAETAESASGSRYSG